MTILKNKKIILGCIILSILIISCNRNQIFNKYLTLPEGGWNKDNKLSFEIDIKDKNPLYNVYLTVRHADSYPFSNLFLFLKTKYPSGKTSIDTLECILADQKGKWIGDGAGDLFDNKIAIKKNLRFPETGKYTFVFEQGMRIEILPLILDFGMTVEISK
jgi:gliding motility-associated lipoprotein GldH